jgi:hypothetical protein
MPRRMTQYIRHRSAVLPICPMDLANDSWSEGLTCSISIMFHWAGFGSGGCSSLRRRIRRRLRTSARVTANTGN